MKTTQEPWIADIKRDQKGLDVRELPLLPAREKCFLLTSPFIEPGGTWVVFVRLTGTHSLP